MQLVDEQDADDPLLACCAGVGDYCRRSATPLVTAESWCQTPPARSASKRRALSCPSLAVPRAPCLAGAPAAQPSSVHPPLRLDATGQQTHPRISGAFEQREVRPTLRRQPETSGTRGGRIRFGTAVSLPATSQLEPNDPSASNPPNRRRRRSRSRSWSSTVGPTDSATHSSSKRHRPRGFSGDPVLRERAQGLEMRLHCRSEDDGTCQFLAAASSPVTAWMRARPAPAMRHSDTDRHRRSGSTYSSSVNPAGSA